MGYESNTHEDESSVIHLILVCTTSCRKQPRHSSWKNMPAVSKKVSHSQMKSYHNDPASKVQAAMKTLSMKELSLPVGSGGAYPLRIDVRDQRSGARIERKYT